ncbi:MAG: CpaF family protein [Anaerolineae bacterium]
MLGRYRTRISEPKPQNGPTDQGSRLDQARLKEREPVGDTFRDLRKRVQEKLIAELDPQMNLSDIDAVRQTIRGLYESVLETEDVVLNRVDRDHLFEKIVSEILGYGPLDSLLADESITEIMVNGPNQVYVERGGKLHKTNTQFEDEDHLMRIILRMVAPLGRRIDESQPMVDGRLPDGSRINAVIPPLSLVGPVLSVRKFAKEPFTVEDLINFGTMTPQIAQFLKACVEARLNIVVSGGTGAGKTTLLNVLSSFIPHDERIITIENAAELQLHQEHVVTLEARLPNIEGKGEVTIRDLVINALRMRPERIVVGEARGGEALDMLQAMNTGHDGSLTTIHSNGPRDTLRRIETMVLMAGMDLPLRAIREQVASALDMVVHVARLRDGSRRIVNISEVQGMEGDVIVMQDIFVFKQTGFRQGRVLGDLKPVGVRPKFMDRLEAAGIFLEPSVFGIDARVLQQRRF